MSQQHHPNICLNKPPCSRVQSPDTFFAPVLIREHIQVLVLPDAHRSVFQVVSVSVGPHNAIVPVSWKANFEAREQCRGKKSGFHTHGIHAGCFSAVLHVSSYVKYTVYDACITCSPDLCHISLAYPPYVASRSSSFINHFSAHILDKDKRQLVCPLDRLFQVCFKACSLDQDYLSKAQTLENTCKRVESHGSEKNCFT